MGAQRGLRNFLAGGLSGYLLGTKLKRDEEEAQARKEERDRKRRDDEEIRAAMGGNRDVAVRAAISADGQPDMADVIDGVPLEQNARPRSGAIETMQRVGTNVFSDSGAAESAADMENFASGADEGQAERVSPQPAYRVNGAGVTSDPAQAISMAQQQGEDSRLAAVRGGADKAIQQQLNGRAVESYMRLRAPQVIDTYLRQGRVAEAKAYRDFIDSEDGKNYAAEWSKGVRKFSIGDFHGAIAEWEDLYNRNLYDDGQTVKLTPSEDGKLVTAEFFDQGGKRISGVTRPINDFAAQAGMVLSPEKLVEFRAQQQAKREAESASLDKSIQLETMRQEGRESAEDRRDARLNKQLGAMDARLTRQLDAQAEREANRGGLTKAQIRSNLEIDAAREMVDGMSAEDIRLRTAPTTATGRTNDLFDPALARAAKLASRRKIGDDEWFDQRQGKQEGQPGAFDRADVAKRFRADRSMDGYTLGNESPDGIEVKDKSGKIIGHYR